jgi:peroxiredoxin
LISLRLFQILYDFTMAKLRAGDKAPDIQVCDAAGMTLRLSELWRKHVLVLVFLRHFG